MQHIKMASYKVVLVLIISAATAVVASDATGIDAEIAWMRAKGASIYDIHT